MTTILEQSARSAIATIMLSSADDVGGHWVTIQSEHVYIKGGIITKGPPALTGKKPSELPDRSKLHHKVSDSEGSYHGAVTAQRIAHAHAAPKDDGEFHPGDMSTRDLKALADKHGIEHGKNRADLVANVEAHEKNSGKKFTSADWEAAKREEPKPAPETPKAEAEKKTEPQKTATTPPAAARASSPKTDDLVSVADHWKSPVKPGDKNVTFATKSEAIPAGATATDSRKQPHEQTSGEFSKSYYFHGQAEDDKHFGKSEIHGGLTNDFTTAATYTGLQYGKTGGQVRIVHAGDIPSEAMSRAGTSAEGHKVIDSIRGTPIESVKGVAIPATETNPHRYLVGKALSEGKVIPAHVLAEYPDLAAKASVAKAAGYNADAAGTSKTGKGLFGQTTVDAATGTKQGEMFDTGKAAEDAGRIAGSKAALDPRNTQPLPFAETQSPAAAAKEAVARAAAPTPRPSTHINGDRAEYTGTSKDIAGAKFHDVEMMEGADKGKIKQTSKPPGATSSAIQDANAAKARENQKQINDGMARLRSDPEWQKLQNISPAKAAVARASTPPAASTADETPREAAAKATAKMMDSEYAFARPSTVANAGEDLANSARHKRNAWRGLDDAEKNGTAEAMVTRDRLLENEPHNLAAHVETNPQTALAMHYAMRAYPAKPQFRKRGGKDPVKDRQQFVQAYRDYKAKAEELAQTEPNPLTAVERLRNHVGDKIRELRGQKSNDSVGRATATDPHNVVANAMVGTHTDLATFYPKKTSVIGKMNDFAKAGVEKYGLDLNNKPATGEDRAAAQGKLNQINSHIRDLMAGKSLPETFGMQKATKKAFNPTDLYVGTPERKGGRDISGVTQNPNRATQHLTDKFGVRGVQWGNSVTDEERAHHAGHVVGALTDLAEVTGMKPEDMSFNGKLGLAIGARGHGSASAHYEPGSKVINLTRASGVGTLAHEWGHALDHEMAGGGLTFDGERQSGDFHSEHSIGQRMVKAKPGEKTVYGGYKADENGKPVLEDTRNDPLHMAMEGVRQAWKTSGYRSRLGPAIRQLQNEGLLWKNPKYWTQNHEMFARTFEKHVQHKLGEQGRSNTYLSGFAGDFDPKGEVGPVHLWPSKEEAAHIAPAMDKLMEAYRTKKYGTPDVQHFSRASAAAAIARILAA